MQNRLGYGGSAHFQTFVHCGFQVDIGQREAQRLLGQTEIGKFKIGKCAVQLISAVGLVDLKVCGVACSLVSIDLCKILP